MHGVFLGLASPPRFYHTIKTERCSARMTVAHHAVAHVLHTTYAVAHMLHTTYAAAHMLYVCCAQITGVNCIIKLLHMLLHTCYIQHMLLHTLLHTTYAAHLEWITGKVGTWVA